MQRTANCCSTVSSRSLRRLSGRTSAWRANAERGWTDERREHRKLVRYWLEEEGFQEEVTAGAIKRVPARQIAGAMSAEDLSKTAMADRMHTSRAALDRLLDPDNQSVTLATLEKAATAVGRRVRLELV